MKQTFDNLKITNRLLSLEAQNRGWNIEVFYTTLGSPQTVVRAEKDGKEFVYSSTLTSLTPTCGYLTAEDKYLTYGLLKSADISTPESIMIPGECEDFSEAEAFLAKQKRVIVKPTCTNHGDGITMNITDKEQLAKAIKYAREAAVEKGTSISGSTSILVQEQVEGKEYRFLIVEGKCIAVANRRPAFVVGDGKKTIKKPSFCQV